MIVFNDSFKTGFSEIDTQHKKLFDLANKLNDAMSKRQGREVLSTILSELIDYTANHFSYEEKAMELKAYPMFITHKKEHDALVEKVQNLAKEFEGGNTFLTIDTMNFLKDWLTNHIQNTDKKLGSFLASHN